ncbi:MAG: hypothetical protein ACOYJK_01665 [Prevotella sp.]|jgi:hypothetical protein
MAKHLLKTLATAALLVVSASASATPFKAVYLELKANETGRGKVYIKTEDPDNLQTRKKEDVELKCVIGENGKDTLRSNSDPEVTDFTPYLYPGAPADFDAETYNGLYMCWLYAEPEDGYELAGYSLIQKDDPDSYTKADLIKSTWTDNGNFEDPYPAEDNDGQEFIFNANVARPEGGKGDGSEGSDDVAREQARQNAGWGDEPDWKIYAVFVKEGTELPDGPSTGITEIKTEKSVNNATYSLDGRRVNKSYKGIVIRNGKKYIQK